MPWVSWVSVWVYVRPWGLGLLTPKVALIPGDVSGGPVWGAVDGLLDAGARAGAWSLRSSSKSKYISAEWAAHILWSEWGGDSKWCHGETILVSSRVDSALDLVFQNKAWVSAEVVWYIICQRILCARNSSHQSWKGFLFVCFWGGFQDYLRENFLFWCWSVSQKWGLASPRARSEEASVEGKVNSSLSAQPTCSFLVTLFLLARKGYSDYMKKS